MPHTEELRMSQSVGRPGAQNILWLVLFVAALIPNAPGQQSAETRAADELFAQSRWEQAAQAYARIVKKDPSNGQNWQNLGECNLRLGKFNEAKEAFNRATEQKFRPLMNKVNIARAYAAAGETAKAISVLKEVAETGKASALRAYIGGASELQKLAGTPEYQQVLRSLQPCQLAEFRKFDFWVGDWTVQ